MMDLLSVLDPTKGDTLWVITTGYDDGTAFYLNGELNDHIHDNDSHEIPDLLYRYMVKYNFTEVVEVVLSDKGHELFQEDFEYVFPKYLNDYNEDHFDWKYQSVYKREEAQ